MTALQEDRAMMTKETLDEKVGASTGLLSRSASQNLPRSLSSKGAGKISWNSSCFFSMFVWKLESCSCHNAETVISPIIYFFCRCDIHILWRAGTPDRTSFTIPENESAPKDGKGDEGHDKTFQVSRVSSSFARDSFTSDTERKVEKRGMILPFEPLSISFRDINYYVDMPAVRTQTQ